jgi:drug/metabolite transporter (DMT)-like permease
MVIFSAVFSKFFLKRDLRASHWIGVCTVAFALLVVAFSALMPTRGKHASSGALSSNSDDFVASTTQQAIGCVLVVVAQVIQASQIVVEEFLLHEVDLHAVLIVGLEGLWGGLLCSGLLFVIHWIPAPYGEDVLDTLYMLTHNWKILLTGLAYATVILFYNLFGMYVTQTTSAVVRTILEGLRCACIWVVDLFIHYVITKNPKFGEEWNDWSYLQLCGFLFLLLGMFVYNSIIRIDGLYYAPKKEAPKPVEESH